ncbi:MAG: T9SS type A sorting domain-containing protein [Bacteroidetes bacterium]|nr:T9SS type A sorting domain-containing protein [Bacteroidota bacterium]
MSATFENAANGTPVTLGTLSLYDLSDSQWLFQNELSGVTVPLEPTHLFRVTTDADRFEQSGVLVKHHEWDGNPQQYLLEHLFDIPSGQQQIQKTADFTEARKTTLFNNFEEFTDEGFMRFRDPWYVNANQEQPGDVESFASPHIPTGAYGEQDAAVFLKKEIVQNKPFYSLKFHSFLQGDYETPAGAPLTGDDWVFIGAYAREAGDVQLAPEDQDDYWNDNGGLWQRDAEYNVDIEFREDDSELFGFYKRHRHSSSEIEPTAINSQRKIVMERLAYPERRFHQVYESDGKIFYTWSEDDGVSWEGEVLLSTYNHHAVHPVIDVSKYDADKPCLLSVAWIDETADKLVLAQRYVTERPTAWTFVDEIDITSPMLTHPTLNVRLFDGRYFTVLIWTQGQDLLYSVYLDGAVLVGERVQGTSAPQSETFDALVLETVPQIRTPKFPTVVFTTYDLINGIEGGVAWSERPREVLRYKGLKISRSASVYRIHDADPIYVSGSHPIRDNTAPGMCIIGGQPNVTYEMNGVSSGFPVPTTLSTQPISIANRSYYAISAILTGYGRPWYRNYNRVIVKTGSWPYSTPAFPYVTQVHSYLSQSSVIMAPSIDEVASSTGDLAVAANYSLQNHMYSVANYKANTFPIYAPTSVTWNLTSDGVYPQIAGNYAGHALTAFTSPGHIQSPANQNSAVMGRDILHAIGSSTAGVRKAAEALSVDDMRQLAFSVNDSAHISYGVASPRFMDIEGSVSSLAWAMTRDTLPFYWWADLKHWIRSEEFEVPQSGGQVIFGTELFARNVDDFGTDFRMAIEFRDATNDAVLYAEELNFAAFNIDSAVYVEDRIDLASITGNTVYFCINPIDTTSGCGFEPVYVLTPWFEQFEKTAVSIPPAPGNLRVWQNFPNPFNPATVIPYELSADGAVRIEVFDMLGRLVSTLHDGHMRAGRHTVTFDGGQLRSGVYICRFSAFGQSTAVNMHLIK